MLNAVKQFWNKHHEIVAYVFSAFGGIAYARKSWVFVHTLTSIVYDESGYMARGFLLASGKYWPYADYGPSLDHMPLSFIIPGYAQVLFGPGIRTGRYFAFTLGLLALLGIWIAARSLGGKWWAAVAIWALALNPSLIESYSLGYSQVLILFFTSWAMVFAIGENRKNWQIILAAILAGAAGMTRLNMMPMLVLLVLYIFWQHGRKAGILALTAGLTPIIILHAIYWPGILKLWAFYIPEGLIPPIDPFRAPWVWNYIPDDFSLSGWMSNPDHRMWEILSVFEKSVQVNLFSILGVFSSILLWPKRKNWESNYHYRLAVFLLFTYLVLIFMHMWAALSGTSCRLSCFKGYLMFFTNIGLFLLILSASSWGKSLPAWRKVLIGILAILIFVMLFNDEIKEGLLIDILNLNVPRNKDLHFEPGTVPLWGIFESKFGFSFDETQQKLFPVVLWAIPILFICGIIPLITSLMKKLRGPVHNFGWALLISILILTVSFSPVEALGGRLNTLQCEDNVIESHEAVGKTLNSAIPPGSKVYWRMESWMMLLYLPNIDIFPPQTMIHYTYVHPGIDADPDLLLRFGYWNEELKEQWINEADFYLIEGRFYKPEWKTRVSSGNLIILDITGTIESCRGDNSRILLLTKNPEWE